MSLYYYFHTISIKFEISLVNILFNTPFLNLTTGFIEYITLRQYSSRPNWLENISCILQYR